MASRMSVPPQFIESLVTNLLVQQSSGVRMYSGPCVVSLGSFGGPQLISLAQWSSIGETIKRSQPDGSADEWSVKNPVEHSKHE